MIFAAVAPRARAPAAPRSGIICDCRSPSASSWPSASIRTIRPTSRASSPRSTIPGNETSGSSSTALASRPTVSTRSALNALCSSGPLATPSPSSMSTSGCPWSAAITAKRPPEVVICCSARCSAAVGAVVVIDGMVFTLPG